MNGTQYLQMLVAQQQEEEDQEHQIACHSGYCNRPTCPYYNE
jgi:hypothetical protein